jgi:hypothetical protein
MMSSWTAAGPTTDGCHVFGVQLLGEVAQVVEGLVEQFLAAGDFLLGGRRSMGFTVLIWSRTRESTWPMLSWISCEMVRNVCSCISSWALSISCSNVFFTKFNSC